MPSIGQVLDLLEALSRRDWAGISAVGKEIADSERKKKHYEAAAKILDAIEIATTHTGQDHIGTFSAPTSQVVTQIPPFLQETSLTSVIEPVVNPSLMREINEFISEWGYEGRLRAEGLAPRHTLLLFGPPGCGKTLIANFIAKSLKMRMFVVRFDSLISSFLGETGSNLRKVFEFLAENRCVLLLDELDAIAKLRDDKNELGELKRVVISLLQNLDLSSTQSLVIGATNHPHMLDPALWRRFQAAWEINLPQADDRLRIFSTTFGSELNKQIENVFVSTSDGMTGADVTQLAISARRKKLIDPKLSNEECLLLVLLDSLRRQSRQNEKEDASTDQIISVALTLKKLIPDYSFNSLAQLTGVSHSTLHSRASAQR